MFTLSTGPKYFRQQHKQDVKPKKKREKKNCGIWPNRVLLVMAVTVSCWVTQELYARDMREALQWGGILIELLYPGTTYNEIISELITRLVQSISCNVGECAVYLCRPADHTEIKCWSLNLWPKNMYFSLNRPHWADLLIELTSLSLCLFVCVRHRIHFFKAYYWSSLPSALPTTWKLGN